MNVHHLIEQRNTKIDAMKALGATPDQAEFSRLEGETRALNVQIDNANKIAELERAGAAAKLDDSLGRELRSYNLLKAVREGVDGPNALTGVEREAHLEMVRSAGGKADGIRVPMSILFSQETRISTVADATSAGNTVFKQYGSLQDRLRVQPVVQSLGATVLTGLEGAGDLILPRNLAGVQTSWVGETDSITPSDADFDQITLSAKSAVAETRLSRKLVLQNSASLQNFLIADIQKAIALAIDKSAINGAGSAGVPEGIMTAIAESSSTETDISKLAADLLGEISIANDEATNILISTALMNHLRKTAFDTTNQPIPINALLHGYNPAQTNQLATETMIAGNFSSLLIGVWNSFSLLIDPYSLSSTQQLKIVAAADVDVAIRHSESFAHKTLTLGS